MIQKMLTVTAVIRDSARQVRKTHFAANFAAVSPRFGIIAGTTSGIVPGASVTGTATLVADDTGFVAPGPLTAGVSCSSGALAGSGVVTNELGEIVRAVDAMVVAS